MPPSYLIFLVVGHGMKHDYYNAGKTVVTDLYNNTKKFINFEKAQNILDFGCGCGRVIRHLPNFTKAKLYGTDLNEKLIHWDKENFKFANFNVNQALPGLPYGESFFDFIYMISIFTHMSESAQKKWMTELHGITKPGGILLFTAHGNQFLSRIQNRLEDYQNGKCVEIIKYGSESSNYFGSYFNDKYVKKNLTDHFELLDFIPGRNRVDLEQDIYIMRKK